MGTVEVQRSETEPEIEYGRNSDTVRFTVAETVADRDNCVCTGYESELAGSARDSEAGEAPGRESAIDGGA